jgi:hypothetical protein
MNDDQRYIYHELHKAEPDHTDDVVRMKLRNETGGESRWVRLQPHVMDLVITMTAITERQAVLLALCLRLLEQGRTDFPEDMQSEMSEVYKMLLNIDTKDIRS